MTDSDSVGLGLAVTRRVGPGPGLPGRGRCQCYKQDTFTAAQPDSVAQGAGSASLASWKTADVDSAAAARRVGTRTRTTQAEYLEWWAIDLTVDRPPDSDMLKAPGFLQRPT